MPINLHKLFEVLGHALFHDADFLDLWRRGFLEPDATLVVSVVSLFGFGGPSAIGWLVVTLDVNSVQGHASR